MDVREENLVTPSVLDLSELNEQYTIANDACETHVRCVPLQDRDDEFLKSVDYWSWSLRDAETRYDTIYKKFLAEVRPVLIFCLYLKETHFIIKTYHQTL